MGFFFGDFSTGILPFIAPAWLAWIVSGLLLNTVVHYKHYLPRLVTDIMEYGKVRGNVKDTGVSNLLSLPKRFFTHFYLWGTFWILSLTLVYFNTCGLLPLSAERIPVLDHVVSVLTGDFIRHKCLSVPVQQEHVDVAVVLSMLSVQVTRRLYECLYVSVFSDARIHLLHYVLGMFFYPAVALTALLHLHGIRNTDLEDTPLLSGLQWYHVVAACLFLWASYHQHVCHKILANLRGGRRRGKEGMGRNDYRIPDGDWFELVSSPHFFAEIVIYTGMLVCFLPRDVSSCWWLVVVFVLSTLSLSARQTHLWYQRKFEDYPVHRRAILPWIC